MEYINCEKIAESFLQAATGLPYKKYFAIVSVGNNAASESYIKGKIKDCERCGIPFLRCHIDEEDIEEMAFKLEFELRKLAYQKDVGAIILQLPLPRGLDEEYFTNLIPKEKDADGLVKDSPNSPCTPLGVMSVIFEMSNHKATLKGENVLIVGRGKLVGRPLFDMLLGADATVTMAHSKTKELDSMLGNYDIIVSAAGKPNLIDLKKCIKARLVIDVGVNRIDGKLYGDCYNFDKDTNENLFVSPVPKGIGLMTRAMLIRKVSELCL